MASKKNLSFIRQYSALISKLHDLSSGGKWPVEDDQFWDTAKRMELYEALSPVMESLQLSLLETLKGSAFFTDTVKELLKESTPFNQGSVLDGGIPVKSSGSIINGTVRQSSYDRAIPLEGSVVTGNPTVGEITQPQDMPTLGTAFGNQTNNEVDMSQSSLVGPPDPPVSYTES